MRAEKPIALPFAELPVWQTVPEAVQSLYRGALQNFPYKIIVLDDDPTGTQTVHHIPVYTDWSYETLADCFADPVPLSFILTNSRSFSAAHTAAVHREIGATVCRAAQESGRPFILISRGDSTMRGHWPLETQVLAETIEAQSSLRFDGEIIMPFFPEGQRYTFGNVHYVRDGETLIPAGSSEFAKDATFGYTSSDLTDWCEEKSAGAYPAESCLTIALEDLRALRVEKIRQQLCAVEGFRKVIVNAVCYEDLQVFCAAYTQALAAGKHFLFRTAAAWVKVLGGVSDQPLLRHEQLVEHSDHGGIVLVGSHVKKTSLQLEHLKNSGLPLHFLEFHVAKALEPGGLQEEARRLVAELSTRLRSGHSVVVYTSRERVDTEDLSGEERLAVSVAISDAVTGIIGQLTVRPAFIVAKGGITSSDVAVKALGIRRAQVMGQIMPGVPVWQAGAQSKFPHLPYVIFPGNVGTEETLTCAVRVLMEP